MACVEQAGLVCRQERKMAVCVKSKLVECWLKMLILTWFAL